MRKQLNLLCSVLALFCVISIYMPVVAPRYPAGQYYSASEAYTQDYFFTGDYYQAREYWSISRFVFSSQPVIVRVILSITEGLLFYWALYSVRGEAGRMGLLATYANLGVTAFALVKMLILAGFCLWGVLAVMALVSVMAAVMATSQFLSPLKTFSNKRPGKGRK